MTRSASLNAWRISPRPLTRSVPGDDSCGSVSLRVRGVSQELLPRPQKFHGAMRGPLSPHGRLNARACPQNAHTSSAPRPRGAHGEIRAAACTERQFSGAYDNRSRGSKAAATQNSLYAGPLPAPQRRRLRASAACDPGRNEPGGPSNPGPLATAASPRQIPPRRNPLTSSLKLFHPLHGVPPRLCLKCTATATATGAGAGALGVGNWPWEAPRWVGWA
jgi:hypothetical protein